MKTIHCMNSLPRLVSGALADRLAVMPAVMPAVVVTGARQTGKSTLVKQLVQGERLYRTLDDFDVLDAARRDPEALVGGHEPITLDEVQRQPGMLSAVKRAIDRNRSAGRFLLTSSANLLLMRQVSESFAGRRGRARGGLACAGESRRLSHTGHRAGQSGSLSATGIALHLAGSQPQGSHLENLVLQDLLVWRDARVARAELGYWRTTIGEEVDVVIEAGNKMLPIEVKATASPRLAVPWWRVL